MDIGKLTTAMEKINVLIVDDSLVIRGMLSSIFESDARLRVVDAVASAEEADAVIAKQIVDVVTLDIEMPGISGLDYLSSLSRRRIPTVMLSSRIGTDFKDAEIALSRGAVTCFNKTEAVRSAAGLLSSVREAARYKGNPVPPASAEAEAPLNEHAVAVLDMLIAEHGDGVYNHIAQRIGFATLRGDAPAVARWMATAHKFDELMQLRGRAQPDRNIAWPDDEDPESALISRP